MEKLKENWKAKEKWEEKHELQKKYINNRKNGTMNRERYGGGRGEDEGLAAVNEDLHEP